MPKKLFYMQSATDNKKSGIDLSVILVTYNHEEYIEEALQSILNQKTTHTYEIIVIDDFSNDKTSKIIESYVAQFPQILKYYKPSKNIGKARKALFEIRPNIQGDFWAILEGDDFWTSENKLELQLSFLKNNKNYIAVTSAYKTLNEITGKEYTSKAALKEWSITDMVEGKYPLYSHTSTYIWRNVFKYKTHDGFFWPEELQKEYSYGDTCLSFFMADQGGLIKCFDEALSCYRITGKGIWTQMNQEQQELNNIKLIKNIDKLTQYKYSKLLEKRTQTSGLRKFIKNKLPFVYKVLKSGKYPLINKFIYKSLEISKNLGQLLNRIAKRF